MKRSIGFIIFVVGLNVLVHAQTPDSTRQHTQKPSPTKQAVRQLKMLQQQLNLTDDQVVQLQVILINRDVALDSLRRSTHPAGGSPAGGNGDPRSDGHARRGINRDADQKINSLLTEEQKPLYQQWKQQQREKMMEKRQQAGETQPAA
jgi:hypothetical protein